MAIVMRLLAALPLWAAHGLGVLLGWAVYGLSPRYRRQLRANLAQAGYLDAATRHAAITEAGKGIMELPALWLRPHAEVAALVRQVSGWDQVEEARRAGKGTLFLTPHLGCFEVTAQYYALRSPPFPPLTVLYSPPRSQAIERFMLAGRKRPGLFIAAPDLRGVRAMLKALKSGAAVGILPDQAPGLGQGQWAHFFGKPAYTMTLVARMSEASGAALLMVWSQRLSWGRGYHFHVERMPDALPGESPTRHLNRALEALVRRCPGQYYWGYNRYKTPAGAQPPQAAQS